MISPDLPASRLPMGETVPALINRQFLRAVKRRLGIRIMGFALLLRPCNLGGADLVPFVIEWPTEVHSPVDVSFLLHSPAGEDGFVRTENGHLVSGEKRLRLWGVTLSAAFQPTVDAPVIAAHLARLGISCVRFTALERGLASANTNTALVFNPVKLDCFDRLVAELKARGIYTDLALNLTTIYRPGDGLRQEDRQGVDKGGCYFDSRLIQVQKDYIRQLLTHRNSYTGAEYRYEPAVAFVELINGKSLFELWIAGQLDEENGGTVNPMELPFPKMLSGLYSDWIRIDRKQKNPTGPERDTGNPSSEPIVRLSSNQIFQVSGEKFRAEALFYMHLERQYFTELRRYLREELKVRSLLLGDSDRNYDMSGYPHAETMDDFDVVGGESCWQRPRDLRDASGKPAGWEFPNTPMVEDPLSSMPVQLARAPVRNKPFVVTAFSHPFPNDFACEGIPILAAYASFQDWDGVFAYNFAHLEILKLAPVVWSSYDLCMNPVKIPQLASGALLFLRGAVKPAVQTLMREYSRDHAIESLRLPALETPFYCPEFLRSNPLRSAVRLSWYSHVPTGVMQREQGGPIQSDTGELTWYYGHPHTSLVTVDSIGAQAVIGYGQQSAARTRHLDTSGLNPPFFALTLCQLDGRPIAQSERLLLTAGARFENTEMVWNDRRTTLQAWGKQPTRIEPVVGKLILRALEGAKVVQLVALDGAGRPLGEPLAAAQDGGDWVCTLGSPATTWYLVDVKRGRTFQESK